MKAVITKRDRTESGMPMATVLDEKGVSHWLFEGNGYPVGTEVRIEFIQKGAAFWEWEIKGKWIPLVEGKDVAKATLSVGDKR
jgi:hypothetical protein